MLIKERLDIQVNEFSIFLLHGKMQQFGLTEIIPLIHNCGLKKYSQPKS